MRGLPSARGDSPVFGLGWNRGAFDDETATRMRCPLGNVYEVLHKSTVSR